MSLLIVGCGYVGEKFAKLYLDAGKTVFALTRSVERSHALEELGIHCVVGNWLDRDLKLSEAAASAQQVLVSVPHRDDTGLGVNTHQIGLENLLRALSSEWQRLVYLSTTGVYGQTQAEQVDELTAPDPGRPAGLMALQAERWLSAIAQASACVTIRLAGIYGPGRIPHFAALRSHRELAVVAEGYLNLIHVDDICHAVRDVFEKPIARSLYVLADGQPVLRTDFYREIASLCGMEEIRFSPPDPNSSRSSRASTNKRISPANFFRDYSFCPRYPSYREGLAACLEHEP